MSSAPAKEKRGLTVSLLRNPRPLKHVLYQGASVLAVFSHHCGKRPNTNNLEREERSYFGSWFWGFSPWSLSHMCLGRTPWWWERVAKVLLHVMVNRMRKEGGDTCSTQSSLVPFSSFV